MIGELQMLKVSFPQVLCQQIYKKSQKPEKKKRNSCIEEPEDLILMSNYPSYRNHNQYTSPILSKAHPGLSNLHKMNLVRTPQYSAAMRRSTSGLKFSGQNIASKPFYKDFTSPRTRMNSVRAKY
jgi:hypothetical protein